MADEGYAALVRAREAAEAAAEEAMTAATEGGRAAARATEVGILPDTSGHVRHPRHFLECDMASHEVLHEVS